MSRLLSFYPTHDAISMKWHEITFQCHLADTDAELDGIKDEKFVEVTFLLQNSQVLVSYCMS